MSLETLCIIQSCAQLQVRGVLEVLTAASNVLHIMCNCPLNPQETTNVPCNKAVHLLALKAAKGVQCTVCLCTPVMPCGLTPRHRTSMALCHLLTTDLCSARYKLLRRRSDLAAT